MPVAVATSLSPSLLCRPASPRAQVAAHLMVLDTVACYWDFPPLCPPPPSSLPATVLSAVGLGPLLSYVSSWFHFKLLCMHSLISRKVAFTILHPSLFSPAVPYPLHAFRPKLTRVY